MTTQFLSFDAQQCQGNRNETRYCIFSNSVKRNEANHGFKLLLIVSPAGVVVIVCLVIYKLYSRVYGVHFGLIEQSFGKWFSKNEPQYVLSTL